ncbi:MAG TPA: TIGR01777 family oxidoreductase [Bryobacteraceae bacterium]|jgi:hypothetical protein|nr:TIGR01777 family oxidoreductase [Bryobacteraceae bacterium]
MRVVITGGTGQVGGILARHFQEQGHHVTVISRHPHPREWKTTPWDGLTLGDWVSDLEGTDALINLAGRSVNCRYNESNRRLITESRVGTTRLLHRAVESLDLPPRVWLNASTATIYRHALDRPMDEATGELGGNEPGTPSTWNFSIRVAKAWEEAFFATPTPATRKIAMRSALTLSPDCGGIFDVLLSLVRYWIGGTMGSGIQFVSWIHEADFVRAVEFLIDREDLDGIVNLASPHPLPNRQFMRALRQAWCVCPGLPLPEWSLEIGAVLLRTETELVLKSRRVVPGRLLAAGFSFKFPDWPAAARELVERWRIQRRC